MQIGLFSKLAWEGICKNKKIYVPYLLASVMMAAIYYIISFLSRSEAILSMRGGDSIVTMLGLGKFIIILFALLFLIYTNSFLMRRRKREFGLYNVLGMNKGNLGRIYTLESIYSYLITVFWGILIGVGLSKLSELMLVNLVKGAVDYKLTIDVPSCIYTATLFAAVYLIVLLKSLFSIFRSNPLELAKSEAFGEKPPKANAFVGMIGILLLAGAYYIAVSIKQPMAALPFFFIAVAMVIIASYILFISGSVLLCKVLQKNKSYYYKKNHFVSVSSMVYRMKRNGAGLASICILLTMVLVMISSTMCLYMGSQDALNARYPKDIHNWISAYGYHEEQDQRTSYLNGQVEKILEEQNMPAEDVIRYDEYVITGLRTKNGVDIDVNAMDAGIQEYDNITEVHFVNLEDYNRVHGTEETLNENEALICLVKTQMTDEVFQVGDQDFHILKELEQNELKFENASDAVNCPTVFLIIPEKNKTVKTFADHKTSQGDSMLNFHWYYYFNTSSTVEEQRETTHLLENMLDEYMKTQGDFEEWYDFSECREDKIDDFYGTFGGLFFLGILLSVMFLTAAVLIIYYKQVTEGYEDRARFEIMQKIGMTREDIRATINSQMLTVFLLPILTAALHTAFAFPMVRKLLMLFYLFNTPLLIATTTGTILVCTLFYIFIYKLTSNVYYHIVS